MKTFLIFSFSLLLFSICAPQESNYTAEVKPDNTVTVTARGSDVRLVLYDIFTQAKKNFIADESTLSFLYLTMNNVPFNTAVDIIAKSANLGYKIENEVYVFSPVASQKPDPTESSPKQETKQQAKILDPTVFTRKFSIQLHQTDIRETFAEISKKTNVPIEVCTTVRPFKLNVHLIDTTLRFALNSLTQAAGLMYTLTDKGTILVTNPENTPSTKTDTATATSALASKITCDQCKAELGKGWKYCPHCGNYVKNITQ